MKNANFLTTLKSWVFSTPGLIIISILLTASLTVSAILALPKSQAIHVPYSYYVDEAPNEQASSDSKTVTLDVVASETALSIGIMQNGTRLKNIDFSVTVCKGSLGSGGGKTYTDSNSDGTITVANLDAGIYSVYPHSIDSPYKIATAVQTEVVKYRLDKNVLDKLSGNRGDDTVKLKNNAAQNMQSDEEDNSVLNIQYNIPDRDANNHILHKLESISKGAMNSEMGESCFAVDPKESVWIKDKNGVITKYTGVVKTKEAVDKFIPRVKYIKEIYIAVNDGDSIRYDLYTLSAYTHKSKFIIKPGWNMINGKKYYYVNGKPLTGWQYVSGHRYYFNSNGVRKSVKGIDVSVYQKDINWEKVAADGIEYAIIRAAWRGYDTGTLSLDPKFYQNIKGALSNGIEVGVYIFSQAINTKEAVEEASLLLKLCEGYEVTFPFAIDIEGSGASNGRADNISKEQRTAVVNAFCATIRSAGKTPMLYTGQWYYSAKFNHSTLTSCPLWIAWYAEKDQKTVSPKPNSFSIWQYSSRGKVNGISGNVDMNAMVKRSW